MPRSRTVPENATTLDWPIMAAAPARALEVVRPRRRSIMPWVVVVAAFGIAFGVGRDRALRAELASELRVAKARTVAVLETTAISLGRQVPEGR